jgi:hypothetical protein
MRRKISCIFPFKSHVFSDLLVHVGSGEAHERVLEGRLGAAQLESHNLPVPSQLTILAYQPVKGDRTHCKMAQRRRLGLMAGKLLKIM